jgi:hypothetical protein
MVGYVMNLGFKILIVIMNLHLVHMIWQVVLLKLSLNVHNIYVVCS